MNNKQIDSAATLVAQELQKASAKFGPMRSAHEGYAIIKEELDEAWDEIKKNNFLAAQTEMIQVAAMAIRFIIDATQFKDNRLPEAPKKSREDWSIGMLVQTLDGRIGEIREILRHKGVATEATVGFGLMQAEVFELSDLTRVIPRNVNDRGDQPKSYGFTRRKGVSER